MAMAKEGSIGTKEKIMKSRGGKAGEKGGDAPASLPKRMNCLRTISQVPEI